VAQYPLRIDPDRGIESHILDTSVALPLSALQNVTSAQANIEVNPVSPDNSSIILSYTLPTSFLQSSRGRTVSMSSLLNTVL
jgi:hypothetical protein